MKRYENDGNTYSLPLKINLAHSKRMFGYNLLVFLFMTLPSGLLVFVGIEAGIKKGVDSTAYFLIACVLLMFIVSLILIYPRHLVIDAEKIQLRCFIFKKEIYWVGAKSLTTHVSDVAFTTQQNWSRSINLRIHKANQTSHGARIGIKKFEITYCDRKASLGSLHFNIATDSNVNLEKLNRTIYAAYHKRQEIVEDK